MTATEQSSYPLLAGGRFETTARPVEVVSPFSRECVYRTYAAGPDEFEAAVTAAWAARDAMQNLPVYARYRILTETARRIEAERDAFATIMAREAGKPLQTAKIEVDRAVQTFLTAAEEAKRLPGEVLSIDWHRSGADKDAVVRYFPVGAIAAITPFNFPLNLVAHKIAPAIAAGCPIVLKPASQTPISALALARVIDGTDLPKGALSVLPMDRELGNRLVTDSRFGLLSFTGSAEIGWHMKSQSGKKKVALELGGNAALIVDKDADVADAAVRAVAGGFSYAGQSCIHTQRIFVEQSIFELFVSHFLAETNALVIGDPERSDTDFSVMISEREAERIDAWVREAVAEGATLLAGGTRRGNLYAPTVLTGTHSGMKVRAGEVFAPVVVIERFSDFKAAVDAVNASDYGLQAGLFAFDTRKIDYAFRNLRVGGVIVNDVPSFRADHMPYGGIKDSGLGREGPKYAIHEMLEAKILVKDCRQTL